MLRLDFVTHDAVRFACKRWHYSRTVPTPPYVRIGVWESDVFKGVVLYSRGNAPNGPKKYRLQHTEMAELVRIALTEHQTPVSRIMRVSIKLLRQQCPGLRLIVSYADPAQGHHGGIYQANGWLFMGETPPTTEYVAPDGKRWHSRMVSATGHKKIYGQYKPVWRYDQCTAIQAPGKLKYLMPLDAPMREQLTPLIKPYPKKLAQAA